MTVADIVSAVNAATIDLEIELRIVHLREPTCVPIGARPIKPPGILRDFLSRRSNARHRGGGARPKSQLAPYPVLVRRHFAHFPRWNGRRKARTARAPPVG